MATNKAFWSERLFLCIDSYFKLFKPFLFSFIKQIIQLEKLWTTLLGLSVSLLMIVGSRTF